MAKVKYLGPVKTSTETPNGQPILTQTMPAQGESIVAYTPPELLVVGATTCVLSLIGIAAKTHGFSVDGMEAEYTWALMEDHSRIKSLAIDVRIPAGQLSDKDKRMIDAATRACPAVKSLHPDIEEKINITYA